MCVCIIKNRNSGLTPLVPGIILACAPYLPRLFGIMEGNN